jgi:hypothetical protein
MSNEFPHKTKYRLMYNHMQPGDIFATTSNTALAMAIKSSTWGVTSALSLSKCNHVAVVVSIQEQFFLVEALADGIRITSCYDYLDPTCSNRYKQVCWIGRHNNMGGQHLDKINSWFINLAYNFPSYDWTGCIGAKYPIFKQDDSRLFCSEAADTGFRAISESLAIMPQCRSWQITPMDIQKSPYVENMTDYILIR